MRAFIRHPADIPIEIYSSQRITHAVQRLKNVSIGGLCCDCGMFLENGLIVIIKIPLVKPPFEAEGRIVWCQKREGVYNIGIQFIEAQDVYRARTVEQICHIEHYKNKVLSFFHRKITA